MLLGELGRLGSKETLSVVLFISLRFLFLSFFLSVSCKLRCAACL